MCQPLLIFFQPFVQRLFSAADSDVLPFAETSRMTNASHIAFITPELDGMHQRRAEYPQQVNAGYGALDSLRLTDAALDGLLPFEWTRCYHPRAVDVDCGLGGLLEPLAGASADADRRLGGVDRP